MMNKTITAWAIGLTTLLAANVAAENFSFEALEEMLVANGHWECHCWCAAAPPPSGVGSIAHIPDKCDSDTEGSDCSYSVGDKNQNGTLEMCSNIFIIDK